MNKTPISRSFRPTPKVVSIPVHFVGSTSSSQSTSAKQATSAAKIQKVFRGFLVRKSIKEILAIGSEVDKAEQKVLDGLDSIRKDPKERLKMTETLMGLLFKLDSVPGTGPGVRDCRKAVIKKAIVLQEIIDGCDESRREDTVSTDVDMVCEDADAANLVVETGDDVSRNTNQDSETKDTKDDSSRDVEIEDVVKEAIESEEKIDGCDVCRDSVCENIKQGVDEDMIEGGDDTSRSIKCDELVDFETEKDEEDYCFVKQVVVGEREYNDAKLMAKEIESDFLDDEIKSEKKSDKEVLERMMEDNGKMMSLMKQLSEQNQAQTQMLTMLSHRVEHLEKAFVREILRKKNKDKKKRMTNGATEGLDFYPDQKKCGKKR